MEIIKTEGKARRGVFETPHGTVQTPAFMNVATSAAIKGAVSAYDLIFAFYHDLGARGCTANTSSVCFWYDNVMVF